ENLVRQPPFGLTHKDVFLVHAKRGEVGEAARRTSTVGTKVLLGIEGKLELDLHPDEVAAVGTTVGKGVDPAEIDQLPACLWAMKNQPLADDNLSQVVERSENAALGAAVRSEHEGQRSEFEALPRAECLETFNLDRSDQLTLLFAHCCLTTPDSSNPMSRTPAGEIGSSALAKSRSEERRVGKECRSRRSPSH